MAADLAAVPVLTEPFDPYLNVSFQEGYQGKYLQVDGSDYDDVVKVLDYRPGTNGLVSLQLEQYSGGVQLSSRVVRYHANFTTSYPVRVDAKGGNDTVINDTAAPMIANGGAGWDSMYGGPPTTSSPATTSTAGTATTTSPSTTTATATSTGGRATTSSTAGR